MTIALIVDTETTGLVKHQVESGDDIQPHLVQLAYKLVSGDRSSTVSMIIEPDGWVVPDHVAEIHGITTEIANTMGVSLDSAMEGFLEHLVKADVLVAHSIGFDLKVLDIAMFRLGKEPLTTFTQNVGLYCTQEKSCDIVKCPPTAKMIRAGRNHFKTPKLAESYWHFTGRVLKGAHNALVDVEACHEVYKALEAL